MTDLELLDTAAKALQGLFDLTNEGTISVDHEEACPEDDTCECVMMLKGWKPASDALNAIEGRLRAAGILPRCVCLTVDQMPLHKVRCLRHPICDGCSDKIMIGYRLCVPCVVRASRDG